MKREQTTFRPTWTVHDDIRLTRIRIEDLETQLSRERELLQRLESRRG